MSTIVKWMLDDCNSNTGAAEARERLLMLSKLAPDRLRIVEINLLKWLRHQSRSSREISLSVNQGHPWCLEVKAFVQNTEGLGGVALVRGEEIVLSPDLNPADRADLLALVAREYKPHVMT